uniref:Uncharacterized protein n=1 Tax=Globisporangium ultimum (strain ATCC 200006 / CBS 805.95 / DAOM BR144) TaxID=431595 RepID=K3WWL6_GLOUD
MVNEEDVEYEIVEVHRLPSVDVSKSVKKALLTLSGAKVYKAVCKKINFPCTLLYTIAFPIGASVLTVPMLIMTGKCKVRDLRVLLC